MERILIRETTKYLGKKVRVCGWVDSRRDHGKIIFIDLRDRSGILQVVVIPENSFLCELPNRSKLRGILNNQKQKLLLLAKIKTPIFR